MDASLEEYEDFLKARNAELQARADASVAAADAAIRQKDTQEQIGGADQDLKSMVEENIHSVLREMDELPEMGIRESIEAEPDSDIYGAPGHDSTQLTADGGSSSNATERETTGVAASSKSRRLSERRVSEASVGSAEAAATDLDVPGHVPATVRLHKAKIRALEQDLAAFKETVQDKDKRITSYQQQIKELQADKAKWLKEKKSLETEAAKARRNCDAAKAEVAQKEEVIKDLQHNENRGAATREKRTGEAEQRAREVRLNRALEEVERYKQLLEEVKSNDRDGKQVAKADFNRVAAENKKLERQKQELVVAFKKQMKLIDVLRRQKLHMEAARQIAFTEEEFMKTLDIGS